MSSAPFGSLGLLLITLALSVGCEKTTPSEADAEKALNDKIVGESGGAIKLVSIKKTDGQSAEVNKVPVYTIDFEGEIEFTKDCKWRTRGMIDSEPQGFRTAPLAPAPANGGFSWDQWHSDTQQPGIPMSKGARQKIGGKILFEKTENGWREAQFAVAPVGAPRNNTSPPPPAPPVAVGNSVPASPSSPIQALPAEPTLTPEHIKALRRRNLMAIGQALNIYANENRGAYPLDLGTLAITQEIELRHLVRPETWESRKTVLSQLKTLDEMKAWVNANAEYKYLGKGKKNSAFGNEIIAHEIPGKDADVFALFSSLNVDDLTPDDLKRGLAGVDLLILTKRGHFADAMKKNDYRSATRHRMQILSIAASRYATDPKNKQKGVVFSAPATIAGLLDTPGVIWEDFFCADHTVSPPSDPNSLKKWIEENSDFALNVKDGRFPKSLINTIWIYQKPVSGVETIHVVHADASFHTIPAAELQSRLATQPSSAK